MLPSIWVFVVRSTYFFRETLSYLQEGDFNLGVFAGFPQLAWLGCVLYQGVFISINAIYDFIMLFFCSILLSHDTTNLIWLTFVVQERERIDFLEQNVGHRTHSKLLKLIGIARIIIIKESTRFSR